MAGFGFNFATKTRSGFDILASDVRFEKKIAAARQGIKKYREAVVELAKQSHLAG